MCFTALISHKTESRLRDVLNVVCLIFLCILVPFSKTATAFFSTVVHWLATGTVSLTHAILHSVEVTPRTVLIRLGNGFLESLLIAGLLLWFLPPNIALNKPWMHLEGMETTAGDFSQQAKAILLWKGDVIYPIWDIPTYMCTHAQIYTYTCIHKYIYTPAHVYRYAYTYIYTQCTAQALACQVYWGRLRG